LFHSVFRNLCRGLRAKTAWNTTDPIKRGEFANPQILAFFPKSVDQPIFLFKSETTTTSGTEVENFKGKLVNMNAIVNFAQIVKTATCLTTEHFEKRNNLYEFINIPSKAEEKSIIQISFRTKIRTSRQAQSGIRAKIHS